MAFLNPLQQWQASNALSQAQLAGANQQNAGLANMLAQMGNATNLSQSQLAQMQGMGVWGQTPYAPSPTRHTLAESIAAVLPFTARPGQRLTAQQLAANEQAGFGYAQIMDPAAPWNDVLKDRGKEAAAFVLAYAFGAPIPNGWTIPSAIDLLRDDAAQPADDWRAFLYRQTHEPLLLRIHAVGASLTLAICAFGFRWFGLP